MHICVLVLVITSKRVHNGAWLLRCCRAIKINQRMAMRLLTENREILADSDQILTLDQPFPDIISTASAEVRTGTISKSIRSSQFAIQRSNNAKSSVCISCQQTLKSKSIQLETYSKPAGIIRPFSRKRR